MYQKVQTCILEENITRIGIKLPADIVHCVAYRKVFTPTRNALDFKHHRSNKEHTNP